MRQPVLFLIILIILSGCATPGTPAKAIYLIARQDRYSGVNGSRVSFGGFETPCLKISGYGSSTFSYKLYKESLLESIDSGDVNKQGDNEILTCWKNLPGGFYSVRIYDSFGEYVDTIKFSIGK